MLKQLFLDFQKDISDDLKFSKLADALKVKILSIFKTINCSPIYKDDFIQECYLKIFDVVRKKHFNEEELNDKILNIYFERSFRTVKQQFIKHYDLYRNNISLDEENERGISKLETLVDNNLSLNQANLLYKLKEIKEVLTLKDYNFLMLFINQEEKTLRSVTEIAKLLSISHQAVSKRFNKLKKIIREFID